MASTEQWGAFLHQCLAHRIDVADFKNLSRLLFKRNPIAQGALIDVVLETRLAAGIKWDPLLPLYIDGLCKMSKLQISTVLAALLKHSSIHEKPGTDAAAAKQKQKCYTLMTDIRVIQDAMLAVSTGHAPKSLSETAGTFLAIADWIHAVVSWHHGQMNASQQAEGLMSSPDAVSLFESLGILLAAVSGTEKGLQVLSSDSNEGKLVARLPNSSGRLTRRRVEGEIGTRAFGVSAPLCGLVAAAEEQARCAAEGV